MPINELCTISQKHVQLENIYLWLNAQYRHPHKHPDTSNSFHSPSPLTLFLIRFSAPLSVIPSFSCTTLSTSLFHCFLFASLFAFPHCFHTLAMHRWIKQGRVCVLWRCCSEDFWSASAQTHLRQSRYMCVCVRASSCSSGASVCSSVFLCSEM